MDTLTISYPTNSHIHYLHWADVIPQGQNTNIISNHIHIYITLINAYPLDHFSVSQYLKPIEIISFYLFQ
jgi:hypothetical protein